MQIDYGITAIYVASVVTMIALPGPVMLLVTGARLAGGPRQALRTIFGTNAASLVSSPCPHWYSKASFRSMKRHLTC